MRLFSWTASLLLLTSALVSSGAAVTGCSSGDDEVLGEEEINGLSNRMGLQLIHDEPSSSLRATVQEPLRSGEQLRLRVRRGRLSSESQRALSCRELPEAPPLPPAPAEDATESNGASAKVVYQGPVVDASLLASVYDAAWIERNMTPDMLDTLAREGADWIVEACIINGAAVRTRLQTSVPYVWDQAYPNLAPHYVNHRRD